MVLLAALACLPLYLPAQTRGMLEVAPSAPVEVKRGAAVQVELPVRILKGFHVNSHQPEEDYLIPLRLEWKSGPLVMSGIVYPKPEHETYSFSEKPLSVFTGDFVVKVKFQVPKQTALGDSQQSGELRYQACNNTTCFPPKIAQVQIPLRIMP